MELFYCSLDTETGGFDGPVQTEHGQRLGCAYYPLLQLAFRLLDRDLNEIASYSSFIEEGHRSGRITKETYDFHAKNGFWEKYHAGNPKPMEVVEQEALAVITNALKERGSDIVVDGSLLDYQYNNDTKIIVHGKSVRFDRSYLNAQMPALAAKFSHQQADISAIRTVFYGIKDVPNKLTIQDADHEALSDVDLAIKETQILRRYFELTMPNGKFDSLEEAVRALEGKSLEDK